jgi:hypothetical protein
METLYLLKLYEVSLQLNLCLGDCQISSNNGFV